MALVVFLAVAGSWRDSHLCIVAFAAETFPSSVCILGGNAKPLWDQRQAWTSLLVGAGCARLNAPSAAVVAAHPSQCSSAEGEEREAFPGIAAAGRELCPASGSQDRENPLLLAVFLEGCFYTLPMPDFSGSPYTSIYPLEPSE